ncbi:hypothetical protein B0J11DRAFT_434196, partial [Dendryphion nanum]
DRTSGALAQGLPPDVSNPYTSLVTDNKRRKAQRQQYLTLEEEKAVVKFLLQMASLGQPV